MPGRGGYGRQNRVGRATEAVAGSNERSVRVWFLGADGPKTQKPAGDKRYILVRILTHVFYIKIVKTVRIITDFRRELRKTVLHFLDGVPDPENQNVTRKC